MVTLGFRTYQLSAYKLEVIVGSWLHVTEVTIILLTSIFKKKLQTFLTNCAALIYDL
jgi:hypothetical protein